MHDNPGGTVARWLRNILIFIFVFTIMPRLALATEAEADGDGAAAAKTDEVLLLEVTINGYRTGKIGEFTMRQGKLMAQPAELRDLGLRIPPAQPTEPGGFIVLSSLPGVTWTIDQRTQRLNITAASSSLMGTVLQPLLPSGQAHRVIESGTGMTLNYDNVGTFTGSQIGGSTSLDLRAFSSMGVLSSDWLGFTGASSPHPGTTSAVRLDSAYTYADVNSLRRYNMGDFITSGLTWNRPVHLEGEQVRSDFSMRPDLITFPLPLLTGSTTVPSTVNILANGNQVFSREIDAGPFQISQLPVISGAGTVTMTVTNAQGQQVQVSQPFYASSTLLAPGLQTYAEQSGLVRRNWGAQSNDYGKFAATAFYRRGLTRKFTIEANAEGTPGAAMAGAGGAVQVANLGIVNFDLAGSTASGLTGGLLSLGAQRIGRTFSLGGSVILANQNYRDVASMNGAGTPRKQISAFTSYTHKHFGSVGAAYAGVDQDPSPVVLPLASTQSQRSHVVSANYSLQVHRVSFYATGFMNIGVAGSSNQSGFQGGLTIPLGKRSSVQVSGSSDGNAQVQAQQSAAQIGQWGYQAYVSAGKFEHEFGQAEYKSPIGLFTAGVDVSGGATTVRLESQGALSYVDHGVFPSNAIYDSFAIVDTNPLPRVHVLQENRAVGSTNKSGRLLVPDLRAFDLNRLAIEAVDIPADASLVFDTKMTRPQDRSGVVVRFPIKFSHGALLRLIDATGLPIELGSTATLRATGASVPVGYEGEAYIEGLSTHNQMSITRPDGGHCTVAFDYHPLPGNIPSIGPLRCVVQKAELEKQP